MHTYRQMTVKAVAAWVGERQRVRASVPENAGWGEEECSRFSESLQNDFSLEFEIIKLAFSNKIKSIIHLLDSPFIIIHRH